MATMQQIHDGLAILLKYEPDGGDVCAEHDEFFAGHIPPDKMSTVDLDSLAILGWRWDADVESWRLFT